MQSKIIDVSVSYLSCAPNRIPNVVDWGNNGLICYGTCNAVAVCNPKEVWQIPHHESMKSNVITLTGHKGQVNAVKWVKKRDFSAEEQLVSVSTDQCGLIWSQLDDSFVVSDVLKGHENSITVVDATYRYNEEAESSLVVVTGSVDSTIRIWEQNIWKGDFSPGNILNTVICSHVISLDSGICISVCLMLPDSTSLLLACALDDCNIHLFSEVDGDLKKRQVLKGHEDWITSLDFTTEDSGELLLASGSQDFTVRLWRFQSPRSASSDDHLFHLEEKTLKVGSLELAVSLESVLMGHDGRVYGVHWHPPVQHGGKWKQPMKLLTASIDKTVVLWTPEEQSGVWLEEARMGEVGGNTLGFYGAWFGPLGSAILALSYQGGFHIWHRHEDGWEPGILVGGHFDAVTDLDWEPQYGRYVLSVSSDQTTRLHAPWVTGKNKEVSKLVRWYEIARPQVHGYDLVCLAMLPHFKFASGADEKVVRVFTAPQNFLENFKRLHLGKFEEETDKNLSLPIGAAVPVLGLSNKAVFQKKEKIEPEEKHFKDQGDEDSYFTPQHLEKPPTEDNLIQNTLWPEVMKLYGHGYEIFSVAATTDGKLLASACKATTKEHAAILLWDTESWQKVDRLVSHALTITQMQFSPDDQFLLSVSRDRSWSVFQRSDSGPERYKLVAKINKTPYIHLRIIWCCGWSHDSAYFATGSRDGKVVVWERTTEVHPDLGQFRATPGHLELPSESITSLAFAKRNVLVKKEYLLAIGSEAGEIRLYGWSAVPDYQFRFLYQICGNSAHHLAVKRLAFRPVLGRAGSVQDCVCESDQPESLITQLASCSLDYAVRLYSIYIKAS